MLIISDGSVIYLRDFVYYVAKYKYFGQISLRRRRISYYTLKVFPFI